MRKLIVLILYGIGLVKQSQTMRHRHWFRWSLALDKHRTIWKLAEIPAVGIASLGLICSGTTLHSTHETNEVVFENDLLQQVASLSKSTSTPSPPPERPGTLHVTQKVGHLPPQRLDEALNNTE